MATQDAQAQWHSQINQQGIQTVVTAIHLMIFWRSAAAAVVTLAGGGGWGGHAIVVEDGRPSAVARVTGAAQWCCSCCIYSNRLTHGPLELLEVKDCLHIIWSQQLQPCVLASWPQWSRCYYPFPTTPPPPAPLCIILLLIAWAWQERQDDVCNWSVCHDIAPQWYRCANAVLRYRRSEKPATISYVAIIWFGP